MPSSVPVHRQILLRAGEGDVLHLEVLRNVILAEPHRTSPEVVDILFQNLAACPVPAKSDLDRNFHLVALGATAPALCLSLFWIIFTNDTCMKPDVRAAVVRNLLEYGSAFCQWIQFCLRSGHPCLPEDELGGDFSTTEQDRYPALARLLLKLLKIDSTSSQALLSSDAFIILVLQLWNGEIARDEDRVLRVMDVFTTFSCPIVLMALNVVTNKLSRQVFYQRFGSDRLCYEFIGPLMDRVQWGHDSPNYRISGYAESLIKLFKIGEVLWYSSALYHHHLRRIDFLGFFCCAWTGVSSVFALNPVSIDIRNVILMPTLSNLFIMALQDEDRHAVYHNWRNLTAGRFFELLFQSLTQVDVKIWSRVSSSVIPISSALLVYPRLIAPNSFGDISIVDVASSGNLKIVTCWDAFSRAFHRTKAARETLTKRPPVHICDNSLCDGTVTDPESRFKQCAGCSSTVYCSLSCREVDWRAYHRKECLDA